MGENSYFPLHGPLPQAFAPLHARGAVTAAQAPAEVAVAEPVDLSADVVDPVLGDARCRITIGAVLIVLSFLYIAASN